jgi:peptidylprolyl isomerase
MKKMKNILLAVLIMGLFSCERQTFYSPYAQLEADIAIIDKYLEENNIDAVKSRSGLRYVIHDEGLGTVPQKGNTLIVHYVGTLLDGTKFDSSYDRGKPFQYTHGLNQVISGWEEGISYIGETGKITLYVPSVLAYGARSMGEYIEPNSNLIFDIELLSVQ